MRYRAGVWDPNANSGQRSDPWSIAKAEARLNNIVDFLYTDRQKEDTVRTDTQDGFWTKSDFRYHDFLLELRNLSSEMVHR